MSGVLLSAGIGEAKENNVFFVSLSYKRVAYPVPVQPSDPVSSVFDFVQEVLDLPREHCRLVFQGKQLRIDDANQSVRDSGLADASKVMLIASSTEDITHLKGQRPDPLVKGFEEEERDERNRWKRAKAASLSAWGTKQDSEYKFSSIKAEFKYTTPPPFDAERLLQRLATDPGIIEIMKNHRFQVGILTEMSPKEAEDRMAKRGTPNMDLLGYNQNAGEMIVLKLRTDSLKGFRPYHDLINTLIHELTHNVWGPHDHNFWKLFGELKAEYMKFHQFWSHGGKAADSGAAGKQFTGFVGEDGDDAAPTSGFGSLLGGAPDGVALTDVERRERAIAAAQARSSSGVTESYRSACACGLVHGEGCPSGVAPPDPGDPSVLPQGNTDSEEPPAPNSQLLPEEFSERDAQMVDVEVVASTATSTEVSAVQVIPVPEKLEDMFAPTDVLDDHPDVCTSEDGPATPPLTDEDLSVLGLDGVSSWLRSFSQRVEALRRQPTAHDTTELLRKLVLNVVSSPDDARFRKIRANNPRIQATLLGAGADATSLVTMLGFADTTEAGERVFLLRDAAYDAVRLRLGLELLETRSVIS